MKIQRKNKVSADFQMSSLTDIIFLLLIFFMITANSVAPNAIELLLPNSSTTAPVSKGVTVSVTGDLEYYVNEKRVSFANLGSEIRNALPANDGTSTPTVVLRMDETVAVSDLVGVLSIGNELGVNMVMATEDRNN